jgi:hypothetical protein
MILMSILKRGVKMDLYKKEILTLRCDKCKKYFKEKDIDESHNIPCYMFKGKNKKEKKQLADKYGRTLLCKKCHNIYEGLIFNELVKDLDDKTKKKMIEKAIQFSKRWLNE